MIFFEWNWLNMKFKLRSTSTLYLILMKNWLSSLFWSNSLGMLRQVSLCKFRDIGTLNRSIVAFQHRSRELSCYNFFTLFINPGSNNIVCYWFSHKCLICFVMSVQTYYAVDDLAGAFKFIIFFLINLNTIFHLFFGVIMVFKVIIKILLKPIIWIGSQFNHR